MRCFCADKYTETEKDKETDRENGGWGKVDDAWQEDLRQEHTGTASPRASVMF